MLTCLIAIYEGSLRGAEATYSRVGALNQQLVVLGFAVGDKKLHVLAGIMRARLLYHGCGALV